LAAGGVELALVLKDIRSIALRPGIVSVIVCLAKAFGEPAATARSAPSKSRIIFVTAFPFEHTDRTRWRVGTVLDVNE
jgi:hypothetical protein